MISSVNSCKTSNLILVNTAPSTEILPYFLMWKFCRNAHFPQNFDIWKVDEITVIYAVTPTHKIYKLESTIYGENFHQQYSLGYRND